MDASFGGLAGAPGVYNTLALVGPLHLPYPVLERRDDLRVEFLPRREPTLEAVRHGRSLPEAMVRVFEGNIRPLAGPGLVDDFDDEWVIGLRRDEVVLAPEGQHVGVPLRPVRRQILRRELRPEGDGAAGEVRR